MRPLKRRPSPTPSARRPRRAPWRAAAFPTLKRSAAALLLTAALVTPSAALAAGGGGVSPLVYQFMVFVIAIFVGYYVVWSVTPALHTPLMSVTNAISSVIVVGALLAAGVELVAAGSGPAKLFGWLALTMAAVNIFGGFLVTQRMLGMYKKRDTKR
jgi:H+-translocating NAD(P) transhydrogenase subunit alpha